MFLRELKLTPKKVIKLSTIDNNLNILSRELESFFIKHNDDPNKEAVIRVFHLNFVRTSKINDRNIETIDTDKNIRDMIRQLYEDSSSFMNEAAGVKRLTRDQKREAITNYNKLSNIFIKKRDMKDIQLEIEKLKSKRQEKLEETRQEAREEAREAQQLVNNEIQADREKVQRLLQEAQVSLQQVQGLQTDLRIIQALIYVQEAQVSLQQNQGLETYSNIQEALISLEQNQGLRTYVSVAEAIIFLQEVQRLLANPITIDEAREVIRTEKGAEKQITKQAQNQRTEQSQEQEAINNLRIEPVVLNTIEGIVEIPPEVEIDLGCNEVEDQDEDDENQDNEICNIRPRDQVQEEGQPQITPGVFTVGDFNNAKSGTFTQQDNSVIGGQNVVGTLGKRINDLLSRQIKRIGSRRAQRTTQAQTIQSRIFDIVHESYSEGKLQAEVKNNTLFKGQNQTEDVIVIYKTDNNLIKRIKNTFNEYVYNTDNNEPITLNDTQILTVLFYGVEKEIRGETKRYKVEKPKPKLKRAVVGGDNTDKIDKTIGCYNRTDEGCGLYALLTRLYGLLDRRDDLIKSVILWFDTHHDFKQDRYIEAKTLWNEAFGETFITWYAKKFFTLNPLNPNQYLFSDEARDNTNVLTPVIVFNEGNTDIPTLLYNISQTYLQNRLFEKTVLLHYIVHNFAVTPPPPGVPELNYSTTLLRDILYVHKNTYNELLYGIQTQAENINNDTTIDPQQKIKMLKGVALKLKPLNKLYRNVDGPNININNINTSQDITNVINTAITNMRNTDDRIFTFTDTLPRFISNPNNNSYVVDVNKRNYLLGNNLQYVPSALFDSNGGNTYEPGNTNNTAYDEFIGTDPSPRRNYHYNNNERFETAIGVDHLGNKYNYRRNGCKLEVAQNNPRNNQDNIVLTKADIRCSQTIAREIPDDAKNTSYLKRYLTQQLSPIVPDDKFIVRMKEVLLKFVGEGNRFAIQKNRNNNTYSLELPKYFNNIKSGPGVQDLVFLTILYRLNSPTRDLSLQLIDNIVNLKRVGDYGQVIDAKMANLPFFTTDNMETLMCIIEKVSCYIDFNQGVIIYDNGSVDEDGNVIVPDFIRSKSKTRDRLDPPGYGRRPPPPAVQEIRQTTAVQRRRPPRVVQGRR